MLIGEAVFQDAHAGAQAMHRHLDHVMQALVAARGDYTKYRCNGLQSNLQGCAAFHTLVALQESSTTL